MIHLNTYNTSYGRKKGLESKCQFDSQPLKVRNHLELGVCKGRVTYCWKAFDEGYNFVLDITLIRGLHNKSPNFRNYKSLDLGVLKKNDIRVQPLWPIIENTVRGRLWLPQVRIVVNLVIPCMPMTHPCTKSVSTMH